MPRINNGKYPPGPLGLPFIGVLLRVWRDPLHFFVDVYRKYGELIHFKIGPQHIYFINHPDSIKHVLQDNHSNYRRRTSDRKFESILGPILGQGLLVSEGELWRRQRRLIQPAFHPQRIASLSSKITTPTIAMLESWRAIAGRGEQIDIAEEMMHLSLRIVGQTLFNVDISDDKEAINRAMGIGLEIFNRHVQRMGIRLPLRFPSSEKRRYQQVHQTLDKAVYRIIAEHRRHGPTNDLLSSLMQARDKETGEGIGERQLRDEVMNLMIAGYETIGPTLAWIWYLLASHPDVERRLHAELASVLGGRVPTFDDLPNLPYTRMVIEETLRLYSPGWFIFRTVVRDDEIGGYTIPAKSIVLISPYVLGRQNVYWENPERFNPERFSPSQTAERPRFAYIPFGIGPRACVGASFALMELQLILAQVGQAFRPKLVAGHPIEIQTLFTLRPRHGILVTLHERHRKAA